MKSLRPIFPLLLAALLLATAAPGAAAPPAQSGTDWEIPGGRFFTQTAGGDGGYSVVDDGRARFWSEFQRLGGLQTVGYPISRRFVYDGFVTQAFQKLVLQWRPEVGQAWPVNVFDELSKKGFDEVLLISRQTPRPFPEGSFDPPGATWSEIVARRQALLDANPAIRARYFSAPDPLNVFGLPTSPVTDVGNHYAIRTQRAVFQQWKEAVPWAARGEVTIANGGDIAKELGWLPAEAIRPEGSRSEEPAPGWETAALLVGPGEPGWLYAFQRHYTPVATSLRLMISDDRGATWRPFPGGLPEPGDCLWNVNLDYATHDALYAGTCRGLYRWSGTEWNLISSQPLLTVAVVYGHPDELWALAPEQTFTQVLHSTDGGRTWSDGGFRSSSITQLAIDPTGRKVVYVLSAFKGWWFSLYRSGGNGQWDALPMPLETNPVVKGLAIDGATGAIYVAARDHGAQPGATAFNVSQLWRSPNPRELDLRNVRWEPVQDLGPRVDVTLLATGNGPDGLILYANLRPVVGERIGAPTLHRSRDGGRTWEPLAVE